MVSASTLARTTTATATAAANGVLRRTAATQTTKTVASSYKISTIIFDVDDCLYDVSTGFTEHRNGEIIWKYMVDHLHFANMEDARRVREKYFKIYHSTAKALTIAQSEGEFPITAPKFDTKHMSQYWVDHLNYEKLWNRSSSSSSTTSTDTINDAKQSKKELHDALKGCSARLVAFSNGPRAYVQKVLLTLGLWDLFGSSSSSTSSNHDNDNDGTFVFGVDDVLPHCKPEKEAFEKIFDVLNKNKSSNNNDNDTIIRPEECIMVEDSMKNIRAAKALGMKTILITGKRITIEEEEKGTGTRILPCDSPVEDDPAVDVSMETIEEITTRLPGLFNQDPPVFEP